MNEPYDDSPRGLLESFIRAQIDARKDQIANADTQEAGLRGELAALDERRRSWAAQMDDWTKWLGLIS